MDAEEARRLRGRLTPEQYEVCVNGATEPPFSGEHHGRSGAGSYACVCCGRRLFESSAKFDSGTGWPSFHSEAGGAGIARLPDASHGMSRTEVRCACGSHLGHVFGDGPAPSGERYCVNSASLRFEGGDKR